MTDDARRSASGLYCIAAVLLACRVALGQPAPGQGNATEELVRTRPGGSVTVLAAPLFVCPRDAGGFLLLIDAEPEDTRVTVGFNSSTGQVLSIAGSGAAAGPLGDTDELDAGTNALAGGGRFDVETASMKVTTLEVGLAGREALLAGYREAHRKLRRLRQEFDDRREKLLSDARAAKTPAEIRKLQREFDRRRKEFDAAQDAALSALAAWREMLELADQGLKQEIVSEHGFDIDSISIVDARVKNLPTSDHGAVHPDPARGGGSTPDAWRFRLAVTIQKRIGTPAEALVVLISGVEEGGALAGAVSERLYLTEPLVLLDSTAAGSGASPLHLTDLPEFPNDPKTVRVPPRPGAAIELELRMVAGGASCYSLMATIPGINLLIRPVDGGGKMPEAETERPANHAVVRDLDRSFVAYHPGLSSPIRFVLDDSYNDTDLDGTSDVRDQREVSEQFLDLGPDYPRASCRFPETGPDGLELLLPGTNRLRIVASTTSVVEGSRSPGEADETPALMLNYNEQEYVLVSPQMGAKSEHWEAVDLPAPSPSLPPEDLPDSGGGPPFRAAGPPLETPFDVLLADGLRLPVDELHTYPSGKFPQAESSFQIKDQLILTGPMRMTDLEISRLLRSRGLWPTGAIRPLSIFTARKADDRTPVSLLDAINNDSGGELFAGREAARQPAGPRAPTQDLPGALSSTYSKSWRGFQRLDQKRSITLPAPVDANWPHFLTGVFAAERLASQLKLAGPRPQGRGSFENVPAARPSVVLGVVDLGFEWIPDFRRPKFGERALIPDTVDKDQLDKWARAGKLPPQGASWKAVKLWAKGGSGFSDEVGNVFTRGHGRMVLSYCAAAGTKWHYALRGKDSVIETQLLAVEPQGTRLTEAGPVGSSDFRNAAAIFFQAYRLDTLPVKLKAGKKGRIAAPPRMRAPDVINISLGGSSPYTQEFEKEFAFLRAYVVASYRGIVNNVNAEGEFLLDDAADALARTRSGSSRLSDAQLEKMERRLKGMVLVLPAGNHGRVVHDRAARTVEAPAVLCPPVTKPRLELLREQLRHLLRKRTQDRDLPGLESPLAITVGGTAIRAGGIYKGEPEGGAALFAEALGNFGGQDLAVPGTGPQVHIGAPVGDFLFHGPGGTTSRGSGTSFSAPQVAAAVAHLIERNRELPAGRRMSLLQLVELLMASTDRVGAKLADWEANQKHMRYGRLNLWKATLSLLNGGVLSEFVPDTRTPFQPERKPLTSLGGLNNPPDEKVRWYGFELRTPAPEVATVHLVDGTKGLRAFLSKAEFEATVLKDTPVFGKRDGEPVRTVLAAPRGSRIPVGANLAMADVAASADLFVRVSIRREDLARLAGRGGAVALVRKVAGRQSWQVIYRWELASHLVGVPGRHVHRGTDTHRDGSSLWSGFLFYVDTRGFDIHSSR